jgi:pyruvate kinase
MKLEDFFKKEFIDAFNDWVKNGEDYLTTIQKEQVTREIKPGDVVRLKSGGINMVVNEVTDDTLFCYITDILTQLPKKIEVPKNVVQIIA